MRILHMKSGFIYRLTRKSIDKWYLSCNDGMVPGGQILYGFCLKKLLASINCTVVNKE